MGFYLRYGKKGEKGGGEWGDTSQDQKSQLLPDEEDEIGGGERREEGSKSPISSACQKHRERFSFAYFEPNYAEKTLFFGR